MKSSWYEVIVGANETEWYPVIEPVSRRSLINHLNHDTTKGYPQDRYWRHIYAIPFWLWIPWKLLFPIIKRLHLSLEDNHSYYGIQYLDKETLKLKQDK
jgi:hypothetical protein